MNFLKTTLLLIAINLAIAEDFFISFQYKVINYSLSYTKFECSKAMTHTKQNGKFLFSIPCKDDALKCCNTNKEEIIYNLLKNDIIITSVDEVNLNSLNTSSKLTYIPRRFDIIINNGVAYFYLKGD